VAEVTTYTAVYEREGNAWLVEIAEEPRCHSWGRTLTAARSNIEDALALWLDRARESFELRDDVRLPKELQDQLSSVKRCKAALERFQKTVTQLTAQTAKALTTSGLSMRDSAWLMGMSHQRIDQLLDIAKPDVEDLMDDLRRSLDTVIGFRRPDRRTA
jgi:predicted RNase H-like HicB family nuclease